MHTSTVALYRTRSPSVNRASVNAPPHRRTQKSARQGLNVNTFSSHCNSSLHRVRTTAPPLGKTRSRLSPQLALSRLKQPFPPRRGDGRWLCGKFQMLEYLRDHLRLFDSCPEPVEGTATNFNLPPHAQRSMSMSMSMSNTRLPRHHLRAQLCMRRRHPVKPRQVQARPGYQRRQPLHELHRHKHDVAGAVVPRGLELQHHLPLAVDTQPLVADRRAGDLTLETAVDRSRSCSVSDAKILLDMQRF